MAFSSNTTNQEFTVDSYPPVEVYDTASDLYVYDTETEEMITCPQFSTESFRGISATIR